jgi:hypothetical protein
MSTENKNPADAVEKVGTAIVDAAKDIKTESGETNVPSPINEAVAKAQAGTKPKTYAELKADVDVKLIEKNNAASAYIGLSNGTDDQVKQHADAVRAASAAYDDAVKAFEVFTRPDKKNKTKKVRFVLPPAGVFLLPYDVGQIVDLPENQAEELVNAMYAEYVK